MQKVARIVLGGSPYLVFRDTSVDGRMNDGGFDVVLRRFILTETNEKTIGCIVFYLGFLTAYSWKTDEKTLYGSDETTEFALANLIPHLPLDIEIIKETFSHSSKCFTIEFNQKPTGFNVANDSYSIGLKDSFFTTAQKIVFKDGMSKRQIRREILQILLNALEENPNTYLPIKELQYSIPITTKELLLHLHLLRDEDKVDCVTQPSDAQEIVSVKIKSKGIKELEGEIDAQVQSSNVVKHIYGTNIENTTYGANSPITVKIEEIKTIFQTLQQEIKEDRQLEGKEELSETVNQLENELINSKNPKKVGVLLGKIKASTQWVYQKIISNPIISNIIAELLMKGAQ